MSGQSSYISIAAMLKAAIDDGKDYIEMCAPLLMGAIDGSDQADFSSADLAGLFSDQLLTPVPASVVDTIANRCAKRGYLKRASGRWIATGKSPFQSARREAIQSGWDSFVKAFVAYAKTKGIDLPTRRAEEALFSAIRENKVGLVLHDSLDHGRGKAEEIEPGDKALVGKFFVDCVAKDRALQDSVTAIVSGLVLRSTLFLGDSISAPKRLNKLTVFLDSKLAFALLGIGSEQECNAVQQGILLLRRNGATLRVFGKTLDEMRRVLAVYQDHLGTAQGIRSLFNTPLTGYFLRLKATPGDVAEISATLERKLRQYDARVVETPDRVNAFTLDEKSLETKLANKGSDANQVERRVVHDVDCVAAVLTLRNGKHRNRIEDTGFVFSTLSWMTAKNIAEWYRGQGVGGYSPCAHQSVLTTISWLNSPSSGEEWMRAGIGSLATLASTVSDDAWAKFKRHLKKLVDDGGISSDEELALLASGFSESSIIDEALARGDDPDDPDVTTIAEAVERVRKLEGDRVAKVEGDLVAVRTENAIREARRIRFAQKVGGAISWLVVLIAAAISITGLTLSLPLDQQSASRIFLVALAGSMGLAALFFGADLKGWRNAIKDWAANKVLIHLP